MSDLYYLDHAASTPVDAGAITAMQPYMNEFFYNPSSPYSQAVAVRRDYEAAKTALAATFGAKADELVITAGATESINMAFTASKGHVVVSNIEHDAVLAVARTRSVSYAKASKNGSVTPDEVRSQITDATDLVSVQLANNEIGTIQPIRQIAEMLQAVKHERSKAGNDTPIYFHCDASQGFGQIDVNAARLGIDLLTLNSAKMYGPKQVALLWVRPGISVVPLIVGGGQERGLRSGTENVAGVVGFSYAAQKAHKNRKSESERLQLLRDTMQEAITKEFPDCTISGNLKKRLPGSLHVSFEGIDAERIIFALENKNVMVATGSACAANKGTRSHVLTAIGMTDAQADGSLRITLGKLSTIESNVTATTYIIDCIKEEYNRVRSA